MVYPRHPNTQCLVCQKPCYKKKYYINKNIDGHVFCSQACYGKFIRKEKPCIVCDTPIMAHFNKKTCSRACSNKSRVGIKYRQGRRKDKVVHASQIKKRLLEERGGLCERCGFSLTEILIIHHKDRNRNNNDLQNLEFICPNCHAQEHYLEKSWLKRYNQNSSSTF